VFTVDVSLVTYNSSADIPGFIDSLFAQDIGPERICLYVVDNASTDETIEFIRECIEKQEGKLSKVVIEKSPVNLGFGRGHNRAVFQGTSEFVFVVNPDIVLPADCLSILLSTAQSSDSSVAVWEPRQVPFEHPKLYNPVSLETNWVSGAAFLCRRSVYEQVGGFDPRIFLYEEDVDLSWRIRASGYRLMYVPKAFVRHFSYLDPEQGKPTQAVYSALGNMYIRARFGKPKNILFGLYNYLSLILKGDKRLYDRKLMIRNLYLYLKNFAHFRLGGWHKKAKFRFYRWGYSPIRKGAGMKIVPSSDLPSHPKVSVLIRTMGRKNLLRRALISVANQTYPNIETVIVQDCQDTLSDFLKEFEQLDIKFLPLGKNMGRSIAGNEAMRLAQGEYFVFLDEDDEFYADHIEQLVCRALNSGVKVAYSVAFEAPTKIDTEKDTIIGEGDYVIAFDNKFSYTAMCHHNILPILTVLFHRSLFESYGGFDPDFDLNEDWDLWLRYSFLHGRFSYVPKTTCLYRVPLDTNMTQQRLAALEESVDRVIEKNKDLTIQLTCGQLHDDFESLFPNKKDWKRPRR